MTGFIAYVFPYPNRVSFKEAFGVLEPDDGKLSRPVLRGPGLSDGVRLLDPWCQPLPLDLPVIRPEAMELVLISKRCTSLTSAEATNRISRRL